MEKEKRSIISGKKGLIIGALILVVGLGGAAGAGYSYLQNVQQSTGFVPGTKINGMDVSGKKPAETAQLLADGFEDGQVTVMEAGKEVFRASVTDLGYDVDMDALEASLAELEKSEKTDLRTVIDGMMNGYSFSTDIPWKSDPDILDTIVKADALSEPRKKNKDAKIYYSKEDKKCLIKPEVQGTLLEDEDLREWLRGEIDAAMDAYMKRTPGDSASQDQTASESMAGAVDFTNTTDTANTANTTGAAKSTNTTNPTNTTNAANNTDAADNTDAANSTNTAGTDTANTANTTDAAKSTNTTNAANAANAANDSAFNLTVTIPDSLYIRPDKCADDADMQEKCALLNQYAGESVTYVFGNESETLEFETIMKWLKIREGEVRVREEKVRDYVEELAAKYETRYHERYFTTTWGNVVTFTPGMNEYGYTILREAEVQQLIQDILSGESVEREPVYMTYNDWGCPLYYGRNGTDDLIGTYVEVNLSAQHMWFYSGGTLIVESDVVTGDVTKDLGTVSGVFPLAFKESPSILRGGEGKNKYETKVQYWMPFYEGQGLHDASWKTKFGGDEYKGNGSHGCVNLPPWVAEIVYNNIVPGTAVILYW